MVDTVLVEQNNLEIDAKDGVKSNRRRRFRRNRNQKENATPTEASNESTNVKNNTRQRGPARRSIKQRAPRVASEGEAKQVREKADYTDGILRLKISNSRPRTVYTRLVRLMLAGYDGAGNALETQKPIDKIEVSALGNAISSAIFVVDNLIKAKVAVQTEMTCDFINMNEDSTEFRSRGTPRLLVTLARSESWNAREDEVLNKTRVYRTKILGLPEDNSTTKE
jgi:hypothetical protein